MVTATLRDLLELAREDTHLEKVASTNGGEWSGPCPLSGCTSDDDAFNVWPNEDGGRWWCRKCGRSGDVIAYMVETGRITERRAGVLRHEDDPEFGAEKPSYRQAADRLASDPLLDVDDPPGVKWQARAFEFVAICQDRLWSPEGDRAMEWLHKRGFQDPTIRWAGLGYNPKDAYETRADWGLPDGSQIWLPRGIVIPWFVGKHLWRVNIRRPVRPGEEPKYIGPAGYTPALYGADRLNADRPAILVEGEFDALAIEQATAGELAGVAVGSATHAHRIRWVTELAACPVVLAVFDRDGEGDEARDWWLEHLPNARDWLPKRHDVAAMLEAGDDILAWARKGEAQVRRRLERESVCAEEELPVIS